MPKDRAESAYRFRVEAAETARNRTHPDHQANPDEARYGAACYPMSFTKGLEHDGATGLVANVGDFRAFRECVDNGFVEPFTTRVPVPNDKPRRMWEAPTAGLVFDLQGPDAQAVTMPPAPELCSDELTYEMAEVYELALLRDVPFTEFEGASSALDPSIARLNALDYAQNSFAEPDGTLGRERLGGPALMPQTAFRGSGPGAIDGPYLSQFMLIGSTDKAGNQPQDGLITYGAQTIDQKVLEAKHGDDHMTDWKSWLHVQNGFDVNAGADCKPGSMGQTFTGDTRPICTPRDLATYVHFDALYQAYLNACLLLLSQGAPFDPAFDLLSGPSGGGIMTDASNPGTKVSYNAGGFALYGGPHILSLVTEVATRGLKAVRYQKFNVHLRLRPEALAGRLARAAEIEKRHPQLCGCLSEMRTDLGDTLSEIADANPVDANLPDGNFLLPMAFAEGSPMHPTYGAGHATVAGACVTMLKAFFDTSAVFVRVTETDGTIRAGFYGKDRILADLKCDFRVEAGAYRSVATTDHHGKITGCEVAFQHYGHYEKVVTKEATETEPEECHAVYHGHDDKPCPLTLEGELNKLAANISIGRNMAGVHYYSDYYDSARMGEEIAIGILEEQALGYQTDPFVMSVPTFDGQTRRIGKR